MKKKTKRTRTPQIIEFRRRYAELITIGKVCMRRRIWDGRSFYASKFPHVPYNYMWSVKRGHPLREKFYHTYRRYEFLRKQYNLHAKK